VDGADRVGPSVGSDSVQQFFFEDLMDANQIHAWEQGSVARALLAGQGFGSPFISTQPSAIMPPVYPLIAARLFHPGFERDAVPMRGYLD
jgi:hypothetical protein